MQFLFNVEQQMLRESMAAMVEPWQLNVEVTEAQASRPLLWDALVNSGMTGVCVPTTNGGSGLGLVEAGCILEALGTILDNGNFLMSALLSAYLLSRSRKDSLNSDWLTSLASGQTKATVLLSHALDGTFTVDDRRIELTCGPTIGTSDADILLLVVRTAGQNSPTLLIFPTDTPEFKFQPLPVPDSTRAVYTITCRTLPLEAATACLALPEDAAQILRPLAVAAQSVQMLGGAAEVFSQACQYARERVQFGKPIGRFQAIKHLLADDRVMLDGLRSLSYAALWQLNAGASEGPATAYAAKIWAAEVYTRLSSDAIQVHGAMGIAAESRPHLYLKRSIVDRTIFGSPPFYIDALHALNIDL
ncbi:acyl-CoA/acyl-ACP dehydrogenase [Alcaligenaceae bacterium]|nr:acyl-CoA/acyl-ACP dehydrogenase [Alcaligenaceae bacterium]